MNRIFTIDTANNHVMVDYNFNPGHVAGQGQVSPDQKFNIIHIPKNGSTEIKASLREWPVSNYHDMDFAPENLVILRDPTDRWISGVIEFLIGNCSHMGNCNSDIPIEEIELLVNTRMFQNLLFNFVIFDGHTLPQSYYLQGIDLGKATFFYHNKQVIHQVLNYVGMSTKNIKNRNNSLTNPKKLVILNKLKSLLDDNPKLQHSIDKHYYADHKLFDQVKFHY